jgi:hypothetical protein
VLALAEVAVGPHERPVKRVLCGLLGCG